MCLMCYSFLYLDFEIQLQKDILPAPLPLHTINVMQFNSATWMRGEKLRRSATKVGKNTPCRHSVSSICETISGEDGFCVSCSWLCSRLCLYLWLKTAKKEKVKLARWASQRHRCLLLLWMLALLSSVLDLLDGSDNETNEERGWMDEDIATATCKLAM